MGEGGEREAGRRGGEERLARENEQGMTRKRWVGERGRRIRGEE